MFKHAFLASFLLAALVASADLRMSPVSISLRSCSGGFSQDPYKSLAEEVVGPRSHETTAGQRLGRVANYFKTNGAGLPVSQKWEILGRLLAEIEVVTAIEPEVLSWRATRFIVGSNDGDLLIGFVGDVGHALYMDAEGNLYSGHFSIFGMGTEVRNLFEFDPATNTNRLRENLAELPRVGSVGEQKVPQTPDELLEFFLSDPSVRPLASAPMAEELR